MTRQVINVGATANDGTGDGLRSAYIKCNDNFQELYNTTQTPIEIVNGSSNIAVANSANVTISVAGSANVVNFAGSVSEFTGNVTISNDLTVANSLSITQDVTIGDQLIINGSFGSNVLPDTNNTRTLGNATLRFASMNTVLVDATGNITTTANVSGGNLISSGAHITTGNVTGGNFITAGNVEATGNVSGGNVVTGGAVIATGNVSALNIISTGSGNITAGGFLVGDGGFISNVTVASNVAVTQVANGTSIVGIASSGGNVEITSGGVLTLQTDGTNVEFLVPLDFGAANVVTTGNVSGGNVLATANVIATGNVSGTYILGDGSQLTGIDSAAISNGTSNVSVATNSDITMGVANSPITIVSATGSATTGIVSATGNVTATGNVAGGNVIATANVDANKISVTDTMVAGGIVTGSGLNTTGIITDGTMSIQTGSLTSVANIAAGGNVTVTGNISGGNIVTGAEVIATGNVNGGNIIATAAVDAVQVNQQIGVFTTLANITGATSSTTTTTGALLVAGGAGIVENVNIGGLVVVTGNITTASGNISGGNIITGGVASAGSLVTSTKLTVNSSDGVTAITNGGTNGTGNIGATGAGFNTVFALATSAQYADVAEQYLADQEYDPGTVVTIGGVYEVTVCGLGDYPAGVVSTDPAYLMNSGLTAGLPIALVGRVPVRIFGSVMKGQKVYSDLMGRASKNADGALVGISLEDNSDPGEKLVECMLKV